MKPTVILVHGAYADSPSWSDVIPPLTDAGHRVIAWANPLRSVASDAAALTDLVRSVDGPVVLVGHLKRTVEVAGASHVVGISHPASTAELVLEAADARASATT